MTLTGRQRTQVNRQPVRSRTALAEAVPVTVFSPGDLGLVQDGPARRRELLDEALQVVDRRAGGLVDEVERILRQRGALLRQLAGRLGPEAEDTLDVWDERLAAAGSELVAARQALSGELAPLVAASYAGLAPDPGPSSHTDERARVTMAYRRSWEGDLAAALLAGRREDVRRAVTSVGPHRDELELSHRRPTGAAAGVPGRAAELGPCPASGRAPVGHRPDGGATGAAARRRVLRARPRHAAGPWSVSCRPTRPWSRRQCRCHPASRWRRRWMCESSGCRPGAR